MPADYPKFMFTYWNCATPTISEISPRQVTTAELITIRGAGFSKEDFDNEVTVGSWPCVVSYSSNRRIECILQSDNKTQIAVPHYVQVNVKNLGYALNTIQNDFNRHVVVLPHISDVSPSGGSLQGGTRLTISGDGFQGEPDDMLVAIDGVVCDVESVEYDTIYCITNQASAMTGDVSVTVTVYGQNIEAECASTCEFTYSSSQTPQVSSHFPTTITSDGEEMTITGSGFGTDAADVTISVGDVVDVCDVSSVTDTEIICTMSGVHVGTQPWSVIISGKGNSSLTSDIISVDPAINSVTPSMGGTNGGNIVTITGLGFNVDDIQVEIGGSECAIIVDTVNTTSLSCVVPSGSSGSQDIEIESNGVTYPTDTYTYSTSLTPEISRVTEGVVTILNCPRIISKQHFKTENFKIYLSVTTHIPVVNNYFVTSCRLEA